MSKDDGTRTLVALAVMFVASMAAMAGALMWEGITP